MDEEQESKRGEAETGRQDGSAKSLVEMLKRRYDSVLNIRNREEPPSKKARLEADHQRSYDCCACNMSFSTIQALNAHMPTHRILCQDQHDIGKEKQVYHWK